MSRLDEHNILRRLIAIKQQRAEQRLAVIRAEQQAIVLRARELQQSFLESGATLNSFDDWVSAVRNKYPERVLQELESLKRRQGALCLEVEDVERDLKTSLHANRQLRERKA